MKNFALCLFVPLLFSVTSFMAQSATPPHLRDQISRPQSQLPFDGERVLAARLKKAVKGQDLNEAQRVVGLYQRHFPRSSGYIEALYQTGLMQFQRGRLGEALQIWTLMEQRFPSHPLTARALLGKATVYDRLQLKGPANSVRRRLVERFPQSQQGLRARRQLLQESS